MEKFDGDPILVLAGYNAGENSIAPHSGVPPYAETRDYVPKVLPRSTPPAASARRPPMFALGRLRLATACDAHARSQHRAGIHDPRRIERVLDRAHRGQLGRIAVTLQIGRP